MKISPNAPCPCCSGKKYKRCCRAYHLGERPASPLELMRSRYTAYALGLLDYIIATTDPLGARFNPDTPKWRADLLAFSRGTRFEKLQILDHGVKPGGLDGHVEFFATLFQGETDISFIERSVFRCEKGQWLYTDGAVRQTSSAGDRRPHK